MKLGAKIGMGFGLLIAIIVVVGTLAAGAMLYVKREAVKLSREYVPEALLVNAMDGQLSSARLDFRGYGYSNDPKFLSSGRASMKKLGELLQEGKALAGKSPDLVGLKPDLDNMESTLKDYDAQVAQTETLVLKMAEATKSLNSCATDFVKAFDEYLASQDQALSKEIGANSDDPKAKPGVSNAKLLQRAGKIRMINEALELCNGIRITNFKAQAMRDPALMESAIRVFPAIKEKLASVRAATSQQVNLTQLDTIATASNTYERSMSDYLASWKELQELNARRAVTSDKAVAALSSLSETAMSNTDQVANTADSLLGKFSWAMLVGLVASFLIGVGLAVGITKSITGPINLIISNLNSSADQVADAANQVSGTGQSLAQGASEQASSLEETSASLE